MQNLSGKLLTLLGVVLIVWGIAVTSIVLTKESEVRVIVAQPQDPQLDLFKLRKQFNVIEKEVDKLEYSELLLKVNKRLTPSEIIDIHTGLYYAGSNTGIDPGFILAIMFIESSAQPDAESHVGAIGLMQLMPATAKILEVNPHNIVENIVGGATYIKQMLDMFNGDINIALAAYNAGPTKVMKWQEDGKTIPKLVKAYVNKVIIKAGSHTII